MEGMRDNLQCPIHLDLLESAKTLPCQHVVCEECIGLWVAKKGELLCPTCKRAHDLPAGGVSKLPTNFMINGLVEQFKKMGKGANSGSLLKSSETPTGRKQRSFEQKERAYPKTTNIRKESKTSEDVCGSRISLMIQVCNSSGDLIRCGGFDSLTVSVYTPKGKKIRMDKEISEEGVSVSFVPTKCGVHRVEALLDEQDVKNSPLVVVVHPEGKFLTLVRGPLKCPRDVAVVGNTLFVTDINEAPYVCVNWLGRRASQVYPRQVKGGKDLNPFGIVVSDEKIYVTDISNNCVNIYCNGTFVKNFGKQHVNEPIGITIDNNKFIYVSNQGSNDILIFAPNLSLFKCIKCNVGKKSSSESSLSCLAINQAEDKLVVADRGTCCLKIINIEECKVMKTITTRVSQAPASPCGVAIDKDDNIYVTVVFKRSEQKVGKNVHRSRSKSREHKGVHQTDYGGWEFGVHQTYGRAEEEDTEKYSSSVLKQKTRKYVPRSRSKSRGNRGVHPKDRGLAFGVHQGDEGSGEEDTEKYAQDALKQKFGKYVRKSRSKSRDNRGVHPNDYGGWRFDAHQANAPSESDDTEQGAVIMYNADGYFLGRFGEGELLSPGGIFIVDEPCPTALVVDMEGSGRGSKGPAVKVFSIQ